RVDRVGRAGCLLLVTGMLQRCASLTEERAPGQGGERLYVYTPEPVQLELARCSSRRCCASRSRSRIRDSTMPISYRNHIGRAMAVCESASGGVRNAAITKIPRMT